MVQTRRQPHPLALLHPRQRPGAVEIVAPGEDVLAVHFEDAHDRVLGHHLADRAVAAEAFAAADPYIVNGVVRRWYVREWTTVVGRDAEVRLDA